MVKWKQITISILISAVCSLLSFAIVEVVASQGVEVDLGTYPIESGSSRLEYEENLADFDAKVDEYLAKYRAEHDTWLKVHHSYSDAALVYSWIPWLLPALFIRARSWSLLLAVLSVPVALYLVHVFSGKEILIFAGSLLVSSGAKYLWASRVSSDSSGST